MHTPSPTFTRGIFILGHRLTSQTSACSHALQPATHPASRVGPNKRGIRAQLFLCPCPRFFDTGQESLCQHKHPAIPSRTHAANARAPPPPPKKKKKKNKKKKKKKKLRWVVAAPLAIAVCEIPGPS